MFAIVFSVFCWKRPVPALAFVIFALPSYLIRFQIYGLPMTLLEVLILILFVTWFVKKIYAKELPTITFSKYKYLIALWLIAGLIAVFVGNSTNEAWGIWKAYFVEPILFFLVFVNTIKKKNDFAPILCAMFASAIVVSSLAIFQKFTGWQVPPEFWKDGRVTAFYGYPNAVGLYLAPIVVFAFGWTLQVWKKTKQILKKTWLPALTVILGGLAMLFAESEGALFGSAAAIGLLIFIEVIKRIESFRRVKNWINKKQAARKILIRGGFLFFAVVVLVLCVAQSAYLQEKLTLGDHSGQIRQQMWRETWTMLQDKRLVQGAGLANYQETIAPYHATGIYIRNNDPEFDKLIKISLEYQRKHWQPIEIYLYPHNIILNFWSEIGLYGLIIFVLLTLTVVWQYRKVRNPENKALYLVLLAVFLTILIHGAVDAPYLKNDLSVLWWQFIAICIFIQKSKKEIV